MKKIILLLCLVSFVSMAQTPWRTLTVTNTYGNSFKGARFNTSSVNLYYGLKNNLSVQSWSGLQYHENPNFQWFSTQSTLVKNFNKLGVGLGFQYGTNGAVFNNNTYLITTVSYQFKL